MLISRLKKGIAGAKAATAVQHAQRAAQSTASLPTSDLARNLSEGIGVRGVAVLAVGVLAAMAEAGSGKRQSPENESVSWSWSDYSNPRHPDY